MSQFRYYFPNNLFNHAIHYKELDKPFSDYHND